MKKMDVIAYCFIGFIVLFVIGACQRTEKGRDEIRASTDKFRIPLEFGDGPNGPGGTPSNTPTWNDTADWQAYLKAKGAPYTTYLGSGYPNNTFDNNTETATIAFQTLNGVMVKNGKVDGPTFTEARSKGMTAYPTCTPPFHLQ